MMFGSRVVAWVIWCGIAVAAEPAIARPMPHSDLAGLLLESDAVVVGDRIAVDKPSTYSRIERFRITRVLRGAATVGDEVAIETFLYGTEDAKLDRSAVLFLATTSQGLTLVSSGLRVLVGGKVHRFEQWNNPGGWQMVPQGNDPADNWRGDGPVELARFEQLLAAAGQRVKALAAARKITDRSKLRAALLAILPPPGSSRSHGGFYVDRVAGEASRLLVAAGDLEGALLVSLRDRSRWMTDALGTPAELAAIASDEHQPSELRIAALNNLRDTRGALHSAQAHTAILKLLAAADPMLRAAAVAAAMPSGALSSDAKEDAVFKRVERDERAALAKLYVSETDNRVLYALVERFDQWAAGSRPARPKGPSIVADASIDHDQVTVAVACVAGRPKLAQPTLSIGVNGKPMTVGGLIRYWCGNHQEGFASEPASAIPVGRYPLSLAVHVDRATMEISLGMLIISPSGERSIE